MPKKKAPSNYTDAYYAKDGYRTKQFAAKLELDPRYSQPQEGYLFNEFTNRANRRRIAKTKGVFTLGIWGDTIKKLVNVQTFVKEKV